MGVRKEILQVAEPESIFLLNHPLSLPIHEDTVYTLCWDLAPAADTITRTLNAALLVGANCPFLHGVHDAEPSALESPAVQLVHSCDGGSVLCVPTGQGLTVVQPIPLDGSTQIVPK